MSLKLISTRQNESSHRHVFTSAVNLNQTRHDSQAHHQNPRTMHTLIMKGCAKDGIEDIKTLST